MRPGVHSDLYPVGTADSFWDIKRPELEVDHALSSSIEVRMSGFIPPHTRHIYGKVIN
jgi:hypothetical protein